MATLADLVGQTVASVDGTTSPLSLVLTTVAGHTLAVSSGSKLTTQVQGPATTATKYRSTTTLPWGEQLTALFDTTGARTTWKNSVAAALLVAPTWVDTTETVALRS